MAREQFLGPCMEMTQRGQYDVQTVTVESIQERIGLQLGCGNTTRGWTKTNNGGGSPLLSVMLAIFQKNA